MSPSKDDDDGDVDELQDGNTVVVITIHRHFSVNPSHYTLTVPDGGQAFCGERKAIKAARQILKLNIKEEEKF